MLAFSSSRWPLVVSRGTPGALPGPLWLWLSSGTGVMVFVRGFVMRGLRCLCGENADGVEGVPRNMHVFRDASPWRRPGLHTVVGMDSRFAAEAVIGPRGACHRARGPVGAPRNDAQERAPHPKP